MICTLKVFFEMFSIIICSNSPAKFDRISTQYRQLLKNEPHEIVGVHDARSLCEGYNRGLAKSRGETVIFSHDDIEIWTPDFSARIRRHLARFDCIGVTGTSLLVGANWCEAGPPYIFGQVATPSDNSYQVGIFGSAKRVMGGIQALDGLFLAFRRPVIERIGWDEQTFSGFHCYDIDCTYRAYLAGYRLGIAMDLQILHHSHGNYGEAWKHAARLFHRKHAGTLGRVSPRKFQFAAVNTSSKQEAMAVMSELYESLAD